MRTNKIYYNLKEKLPGNLCYSDVKNGLIKNLKLSKLVSHILHILSVQTV